MKHKALNYLLIALSLLAAFFSWQSLDRAIIIQQFDAWLISLISFSFLVILLYLVIILIRDKTLVASTFALSFLFSLLLDFEFSKLAPLAGAFLIVAWAIARIKKDLQMNIKLDLWKSIRMGSTLMIMAVAIVISSQYYFSIKKLDAESLVKQSNIGSITGDLTSKILTRINPAFKNIDQQGLTVDQFIAGNMQVDEVSAGNPDIDSEIDEIIASAGVAMAPQDKNEFKRNASKKVADASREIIKSQNDLIFKEGRKKLSDIAGKELAGNEKISDVISDIINKKISHYLLGSGLADSKSSPLPIIFSIAIFLTVFPLGSFLNAFWIIIAEIIFFTLVYAKMVNVAKVPVEMEIIE